jgi:hypothetical protein
MLRLWKQMISFGGEDMLEEFLGENLVDESACLYVEVTHDETTLYSKGGLTLAWFHAMSGRMVDKGKGDSRMISAYCSELIGWLRQSARIINPKRDKDGTWKGANFLEQLPNWHLSMYHLYLFSGL